MTPEEFVLFALVSTFWMLAMSFGSFICFISSSCFFPFFFLLFHILCGILLLTFCYSVNLVCYVGTLSAIVDPLSIFLLFHPLLISPSC